MVIVRIGRDMAGLQIMKSPTLGEVVFSLDQ